MEQQPEVKKLIDKTSGKPKTPLTRNEKIRDFSIGFFAWWLINGIAWFGLTSDAANSMGENGLLLFICVIPLFYLSQLVAIIVFAFRRGWIALGSISAIALNLFITLVLGLTFNATCFIPFFISP